MSNQHRQQTSEHRFVRPGQVAPDHPAPDRCMECSEPFGVHALRAVPNYQIRSAALGPRSLFNMRRARASRCSPTRPVMWDESRACSCRNSETGKLLGNACPNKGRKDFDACYVRYEAPRPGPMPPSVNAVTRSWTSSEGPAAAGISMTGASSSASDEQDQRDSPSRAFFLGGRSGHPGDRAPVGSYLRRTHNCVECRRRGL